MSLLDKLKKFEEKPATIKKKTLHPPPTPKIEQKFFIDFNNFHNIGGHNCSKKYFILAILSPLIGTLDMSQMPLAAYIWH